MRVAAFTCSGGNGRIDTTIGPVKNARGSAGDVRAVHRHAAVLLEVADRDAGRQQSVLERERAAEQEGDEIVAPQASRSLGSSINSPWR
jgi:hypothetical protein